jgi:thioredoxin-related protein
MRLVMIVTLFALSLFANGIEWENNFEAAKAKAQKEDKILYVLITSETCRWCRKLESTTLEETAVVENVNSKYAAVALTRGKDKYPPCLKAPMVPMSYFLTPDGRVIYSVPGYWEEEDYLSMMEDVERKYKKQKSIEKEQ